MDMKYKEVRPVNPSVVVAELRVLGQVHTIEFAIDQISGRNLREVLEAKPFGDDAEAPPYSYAYAGHTLTEENGGWSHYVEVSRGKSRRKVKVPCSRRFTEHLTWLNQVKSPSEIAHILQARGMT